MPRVAWIMLMLMSLGVVASPSYLTRVPWCLLVPWCRTNPFLSHSRLLVPWCHCKPLLSHLCPLASAPLFPLLGSGPGMAAGHHTLMAGLNLGSPQHTLQHPQGMGALLFPAREVGMADLSDDDAGAFPTLKRRRMWRLHLPGMAAHQHRQFNSCPGLTCLQ